MNLCRMKCECGIFACEKHNEGLNIMELSTSDNCFGKYNIEKEFCRMCSVRMSCNRERIIKKKENGNNKSFES